MSQSNCERMVKMSVTVGFFVASRSGLPEVLNKAVVIVI